MVAPYWAPTNLESFISGPSKVFYHLYYAGQADSIAILENATSDVLSKFGGKLPQGKTFNASWMLVITWKDIRHKVLHNINKNLVSNTCKSFLPYWFKSSRQKMVNISSAVAWLPDGTFKLFLCICGGGYPRTVPRGYRFETSLFRSVSRFFSLNVKLIM